MRQRRARGFTLVECAVVCAVVALMAAVAWPRFQGHTLRAARLDAVQALTQVQVMQEQYRSHHGLYAADLAVLRGVEPVSRQGRYTLSVRLTGPDAYQATAQARGSQTRDGDCQALTLDVNLGFATTGPGPTCWNR